MFFFSVTRGKTAERLINNGKLHKCEIHCELIIINGKLLFTGKYY